MLKKFTKSANAESLIFFACSFFASIFHYLFSIVMGRMLGPENYGTLMALIALVVIIAVPLATLQMVISKYVAEFLALQQLGVIKAFFYKILRYLVTSGIVLAIVIVSISGLLSKLLRIDSIIPFICMASIPLPFTLITTTRGVLQGLQKFWQLGLNMIIEGMTRFASAVLLVLLGLGVNGALLASTISGILAFLISFKPIAPILKQHSDLSVPKNITLSSLIGYTGPALLTQLSITVLTFIDLVIVKRYFLPIEAGKYASAEVLGKIVFFIAAPISMLMFPKVAYLNAQGKKPYTVLLKSISATIALCTLVTIGYFTIPEFIVLNMFGIKYVGGIPYLGTFGIVMTAFAILNLLALYQLSLNRMRYLPVLLGMTLLQVILLVFFHGSLFQVLHVLLICGWSLVAINVFLIII